MSCPTTYQSLSKQLSGCADCWHTACTSTTSNTQAFHPVPADWVYKMEIWYICKYSWFDPVLSKKPTWFADELYWCQFIVEHTLTICTDALIHMHWATMTWIRSENIFFFYPVRLSVNSSCVQLLTEQSILIQAGSKTGGSLASSDAS